MGKKIILLMLILPLLTMIILYTTSNRISLKVDMKVDKVEINDNELVALEMNEENYKINYSVYPTNATNKEVKFEYDKSIIDVTEEGIIKPKSVGQTSLSVVTVDGGFKDSVIIDVYSNTIDSFDVRFESKSLFVGESLIYTPVFNPTNTTDDRVEVTSSNPNVIRVNNNKLVAVSKGDVEVTFTPMIEPKLAKTYNFSVFNKDILDIEASYIETYYKDGEISLSIDTTEEYSVSVNATKVDGTNCDELTLTYNDNTKKVNYSYINSIYEEVNINITILLKSGASLTKTCMIKLTDVRNAQVMFDSTFKKVVVGGKTALAFLSTPSNAPFEFTVTANNDNVTVIAQNSASCYLEATKVGLTVITLTATLGDVVKTTEMELFIVPKTLIINENNKTFGIENMLTVGGYNTSTPFKLNYSINGTLGSEYKDYLKYETNNNNVTINQDGTFNIKTGFNDIVNIKILFSYKNAKVESKEIKVRCIADAHNVNNYKELRKEVLAKNQVVVHSDILEFTEEYTEILTTYDWEYYKNLGFAQPKVKILLPIRNNIYGNGYRISANSVSNRTDRTGHILLDNAIFRGPLNFVEAQNTKEQSKTTETQPDAPQEGLQTAAVKAQDNIVFALYDNVTINNCNLESGTTVTDLTELDYCGTVVEVLGDNVNILNCRIKNGRTVLRIFGDEKDPNKILNVNIENSILSNGREFILRTGSNKFIQDKNNNTPKLPNDNLNDIFPRQRLYFNMSKDEKKAYDNNFITNFITLNNVCFEKSGIFSIGMDSHFSGKVLHDARDFAGFGGLVDGWYNLAKTSYGSKLIFKNDVRIYDWKAVESVDSSTLIDVAGSGTFDDLKFDVKELIVGLKNNPQFASIVYNDQTYKDYVHGGIAYFGGGKNYNVLEFDNSYIPVAALNNYVITLNDVNKTILEIAAGSEPFYFYLFDGTSSFTPADQDRLYKEGIQFDFILK